MTLQAGLVIVILLGLMPNTSPGTPKYVTTEGGLFFWGAEKDRRVTEKKSVGCHGRAPNPFGVELKFIWTSEEKKEGKKHVTEKKTTRGQKQSETGRKN